jgi:hypothetical protein
VRRCRDFRLNRREEAKTAENGEQLFVLHAEADGFVSFDFEVSGERERGDGEDDFDKNRHRGILAQLDKITTACPAPRVAQAFQPAPRGAG